MIIFSFNNIQFQCIDNDRKSVDICVYACAYLYDSIDVAIGIGGPGRGQGVKETLTIAPTAMAVVPVNSGLEREEEEESRSECASPPPREIAQCWLPR